MAVAGALFGLVDIREQRRTKGEAIESNRINERGVGAFLR